MVFHDRFDNARHSSRWSVSRAVPGLVCLLLSLSAAIGQDSQPGLVATYRDDLLSVTDVTATPNFFLKPAESIDSLIKPEFTAEFEGVVKIARAGKYRFLPSANVTVNGAAANEFVQLATGDHPIAIRYERKNGEAKLTLRWESEFFPEEPVPSGALGHVKEPKSLSAHQAVKRGRYLFAELGCGNCHAAANWKLQSRRGPDLSAAGDRLHASWLNEWLKSPQNYRKSAVMPVCLENEQERLDVTAFVMSLTSDSSNSADAVSRPDQIDSGKELFDQVGCTKCHDKNNNLDAVGSKYSKLAPLAEFITNPHKRDPGGRMPQLFKPAEEAHLAANVAAFLFHSKKKPDGYPVPPSGDAARGEKLFTTSGCSACHTVGSKTFQPEQLLAGPAFGQPIGLPLRRAWDFGTEGDTTVIERVQSHREKVDGTTKLVTSRPGHGQAFEFDGRTFIEVPHFHRPDTMTISVWVKTTEGGSIITWGRPGGTKRGSRELRMNIGQDGKNSICYGEYNSDGGWKPVVIKPDDVNLIDNEWHHVAVVRDGVSIQHYVDGKAYGKPGKTQPGPGDYTDRLLIGALGLSANPTNRFRGLMDDLSVWEMALSPEQITRLAHGESALTMARPKTQRQVHPLSENGGCLSPDVPRQLPVYHLTNDDRIALQRFLRSEQPLRKSKHHDAPLAQSDLLIKQFRCTACHELNDQNVQAAVRVTERGKIVRVERPPLLTGIGAKLTNSHLKKVLIDGKRNRPWLKLRMPHFGDGIHSLPELLAATAGYSANSSSEEPDKALAEAGLVMIGERRGKASCIACHNYRGINRRKDGVVPAPDLSEAGQTVRREWFERWMHDPQRLLPGTSMPLMFTDVSAEERRLKIDQLWSAIVYQDQLPLPKGVLDRQTEGTKIVVGDEPVIFRMATKTPAGQIDRAINVGLPGGRNFTFDAVTCQLKYAWKGPFLDAGPAWNGRGGNPVTVGGKSMISITEGHVVRIGKSEPESLRFRGYRLVNQMPVFRYEVDGASIEHRVDLSPTGVRQSIRVTGANDDVLYIGSDNIPFESSAGKRNGNMIRIQKADVVEFQIEMGSDGK